MTERLDSQSPADKLERSSPAPTTKDALVEAALAMIAGGNSPVLVLAQQKLTDQDFAQSLLDRLDSLRSQVALLSARSAGTRPFEIGFDGFSDHHKQEVRKHWDYLVNKYADMPPRTDTSNALANVINDASNLAAGIRRYARSATERTAIIEECAKWLNSHPVYSGAGMYYAKELRERGFKRDGDG
jgi:hypothetical protein